MAANDNWTGVIHPLLTAIRRKHENILLSEFTRYEIPEGEGKRVWQPLIEAENAKPVEEREFTGRRKCSEETGLSIGGLKRFDETTGPEGIKTIPKRTATKEMAQKANKTRRRSHSEKGILVDLMEEIDFDRFRAFCVAHAPRSLPDIDTIIKAACFVPPLAGDNPDD